MVTTDLGKTQSRATFQQQYVLTGFGQYASDDSARGARASPRKQAARRQAPVLVQQCPRVPATLGRTALDDDLVHCVEAWKPAGLGQRAEANAKAG